MENIIPCMEVFPYIFSYMENTGSIKFEYITFDLDVWKFLSTWKYNLYMENIFPCMENIFPCVEI